MDVSIGRFGVWRMVSAITPEAAQTVEGLGYGAIWVGGSPGGDLQAVESLLQATKRIPVATGIVNMWREEAETVAASYRRVEDSHPGRFVLGVGIGHPEATKEWANPFDKIDDYLDRLDGAGIPQGRQVLAALGPRALTVAAERTAGAHPYLTTPRHTRFARELIGAGPLLAPEQKVVIDVDTDRARTAGRQIVSRYLGRRNYVNSLLREGWAADDLTDGGSDHLVDALVLHGTVDQVAEGLTAHLEAGADHVGVHVLGDDPLSSYQELARVLFA